MPIIIISRGVHYKGEEVAEKTAERLGFECISYDVLPEASKRFDVPEEKLKKALENAPRLLERLSHEKERHIAYIQSVLLQRLKKDNVVYHGQAGHFLVQDVSHALSVRIVHDIKDRLTYCMETQGVSETRAYEILKKRDEERARWGKYLYGADITSPNLYDVVVNIQKLSVDDAVEIICRTAALEKFRATPESRQVISDLAVAAEVKAVLMEEKPPRGVTAKDGIITVKIEAPLYQEAELTGKIRELCKSIYGVKEIRLEPYSPTIEIVE